MRAVASPPLTRGRTLDDVAGVYDLLCPLLTLGQEKRIAARAVDALELGGGERVLDVGCATGTVTIEAAHRLTTGSVVGLDAASRMIEIARRKARRLANVRFRIGPAEALGFPDGYFDCAVSTFFFHHVDLELKKRCLAELYRVLRPGGRMAVADVDTPSNPFGALCAWCGYALFRQEEILENIRGKLREAFDGSEFSWKKTSSHSGYISLFVLTKRQSGGPE